MKAARFHAQKDIRIEDIPEPEVTPGTVKIKIEWCGICGTDLHEYLEGPIFIPEAGHPHPLSGEAAPVTLGHEFSGVVTELGEGAEGFSVGEKVVVEPLFVCDECPACLAGNYNDCQKMGFRGLAGGGGGLSEYVVAPTRWVHSIGDLSTEEGALVEPLSVVHHAVRLLGVEGGETAVVFGAGPIGLLAIALLKAKGAKKVIVSEMADARKAKAHAAGADLVLDPREDDVVKRIAEETGGAGADVALECAGVDVVLDTAMKAVKPTGRIMNVAIRKKPAIIDMTKLVNKEIQLAGTIGYAHDHEPVIRLLQEGRIDVKPFITERIALDDLIEKGFRALIEHKDTEVKILVHP